MPFTENQKAKFITLLQAKGWELRDGVIWSPSGGLHLGDAHFSDWTPAHVSEMFAQRAARLEKYKSGPLEHAAGENLQASWAAEQVT
jgi:hypothetical protein